MLFTIRQLSSESLTELLNDTQSEGLKLGHWVDAKAEGPSCKTSCPGGLQGQPPLPTHHPRNDHREGLIKWAAASTPSDLKVTQARRYDKTSPGTQEE